jgi:hypothetical protein
MKPRPDTPIPTIGRGSVSAGDQAGDEEGNG